MRKISDNRVCFVVSLKEVKKYGLCPLGQLKRNPEARVLFPEKAKEVKTMSAKELAKRNDVLRRSIPSRCKGFRFTSPKFCLLMPSY